MSKPSKKTDPSPAAPSPVAALDAALAGARVAEPDVEPEYVPSQLDVPTPVVPAAAPWSVLATEKDGVGIHYKLRHADGETTAMVRVSPESAYVGFTHPNRDAATAWAFRIASLAYRARAEIAAEYGKERHESPSVEAYDILRGSVSLKGPESADIARAEFGL